MRKIIPFIAFAGFVGYAGYVMLFEDAAYYKKLQAWFDKRTETRIRVREERFGTPEEFFADRRNTRL